MRHRRGGRSAAEEGEALDAEGLQPLLHLTLHRRSYYSVHLFKFLLYFGYRNEVR